MSSITHIVDDEKVLNEYEYDAWGEVVSEKETVKNRFKFNGQQLDPITQQYYLRARFYNPVIARFTQEDTYRGDGLNLYAYCRNNPTYYVDPTGHARTCVKEAYDAIRTANPGMSALDAHKLAMEQAGVQPKLKPAEQDNSDFRDLMSPEEAERYDNYWRQGSGSIDRIIVNGERVLSIMDGNNVSTRQRLYTTPGTRSITDVKLSGNGEMYYRETIFDEFGRRIGNNDYTDHGRPDIPTHTDPHYHSNPYNNPSQHGKPISGLHPNTP